jgi:hypothetical protein
LTARGGRRYRCAEMSQWVDVAGLVFGFVRALILMLTTGCARAGAVHSWAPPRWAHYLGWSLLSLGFLSQLGRMLIPHNQTPAIALPSRTLSEFLVPPLGQFIVVAVAAYLGSYLRKKDITELTRKVEEVRSEYVRQNQMLVHQQKLAIEQGTHRHQLRLAAACCSPRGLCPMVEAQVLDTPR